VCYDIQVLEPRWYQEIDVNHMADVMSRILREPHPSNAAKFSIGTPLLCRCKWTLNRGGGAIEFLIMNHWVMAVS